MVSFVKAINGDLSDGIDHFEATLSPTVTLIYGDRAERLEPGERFMFTETVFGPCTPTIDTVHEIRVGMYYPDESDLDSGTYSAFVTTKTGHFLIIPVCAEVMVLMDVLQSWDQSEFIDQYERQGAIEVYV
jgi:hypothetical protein